ALAGAERLREGVAERRHDVLGRVVLVDLEVAACKQLEVEAPVEGEGGQEGVEEADPRGNAGAAPAVEVERDPERRLGGRAHDERGAPARRPLGGGAERAEDEIVLRRLADRDAKARREAARDE